MSVAETEGYVETLLRPPERQELGALLSEVRRLLDAGACTDAKESAGPGGLSVTLFSGIRHFSMILFFTSGGECGRIIERLTAALSFRPPFSRYLAAREAINTKGSKLL